MRTSRRDGPARDVFDGFYRDHFDGAWRALARLGVSAAECEDAAQEVFVTAHRRWAAFDDGIPRRAWLLGIVRRIAWRYRRSEGRRVRKLEALAHEQPVPLSPDDVIAHEQALRMLEAFLDTLDLDKREAFVLGELEELGRRELGHALGVNPNTAYSRLQAARRKFLTHFAVLDDDGCAALLAHADAATSPTDDVANRSRARVVSLAWPSGAIATWGSAAVGAFVPSFAIVLVVIVAATVRSRSAADDPPPAAADRIEIGRVGIQEPAALPASTVQSSIATVLPGEPFRTASHTPAKHDRAARPAAESEETAQDPNPAHDEHALLLRAREAMVRGDHASARRALAEHAALWGDSSALASLRKAILRDLDGAVIRTPRSGDSP